MVEPCPFCLVLCVAVHLEQCLYFVQKRFFGGIIRCSEVRGSLEHQVLEVVGETCCLCRVVLSSHLHGNVGLDARSLLVYGHIYLQTVVKGVDLCLKRVTCHSLISVL